MPAAFFVRGLSGQICSISGLCMVIEQFETSPFVQPIKLKLSNHCH
jgi:hypothetical protein